MQTSEGRRRSEGGALQVTLVTLYITRHKWLKRIAIYIGGRQISEYFPILRQNSILFITRSTHATKLYTIYYFPMLQVKDEFSFPIYLEGVYFPGRVFSYTKSDHSTHIENSCHKTLYCLLQVKDEFSFLYYLFKYEKTHSTHIENSCHKTL